MLKKIKIWFSRHEKGLLRAKNIIFIILGALLVADTIFVSRIIPGNLGAYLPAMLGLPILILGVLDVPLRRLFSAPLLLMRRIHLFRPRRWTRKSGALFTLL